MQPLERILEHFDNVSSVPRGTKHEARIREWLKEWAGREGLETRVDHVGNLVIYVPSSQGYEKHPAVILQGHMDMVWQKIAGSQHDFTRDPIRVIREGDWLKADGTTLGADNGIAIALMMAIAEDKQLPHPPLELLLTVEEELGVTGALNIDPGLISGRTLINLDSEEDGVFTIGSAGGQTLYMVLPAIWEPSQAGWTYLRLEVLGLQGGHSGGDIDKNRGNSNKLMGRVLGKTLEEIPIQLAAIKGGTVRNAIPREAEAVFVLPSSEVEKCRDLIARFEVVVQKEYARTEPGLRLQLGDWAGRPPVVSAADSRRIIQLIMALPNGVSSMSTEMEGLVETSNNVGIMELDYQGFRIVSNHRSALASRLEEIVMRVEAIALLAGVGAQRNTPTAPWEPDRNATLLKKCIEVYRSCFGQEPLVQATHGGLECGLLNARCGPLQAISMGPTILNPHSPDETLHIPSVGKLWEFLAALLKEY